MAKRVHVVPIIPNGDGTFTISKADLGKEQIVLVAITDATYYVHIKEIST
ncbi:MAG: hypothetical protein ABII22_05955 [Candidatus Micrarchaeota archaeon]